MDRSSRRSIQQPPIITAILVAARTDDPGRRRDQPVGTRRRLLVEERLPGDVLLEWDALGTPVGLYWPAGAQAGARLSLKLKRDPGGGWRGTVMKGLGDACKARQIALSGRAARSIFDSYQLKSELMAPLAAMHLSGSKF